MGGMFSVQVPVPDERMQEMIAKLKRKFVSREPRRVECVGISLLCDLPVTDSDLRVLYSKFTKYDQEVRRYVHHLPDSARD